MLCAQVMLIYVVMFGVFLIVRRLCTYIAMLVMWLMMLWLLFGIVVAFVVLIIVVSVVSVLAIVDCDYVM